MPLYDCDRLSEHDARIKVADRGWKVFASDRSSPVQGTPTPWDGTFPAELPAVTLDMSENDCAAGWNYCRNLHDALRHGGLWPRTGRPSIVAFVEPIGPVVHRGDKSRAGLLRLVREATPFEVELGIRELSVPFAPHVDEMVREQLAWRNALARSRRDAADVERSLTAALAARGLSWSLRRFDTEQDARAAWAAWDARDAWGSAWAAWGAWGSAWAAWDARDAWEYALDDWGAWDAWDARGSAWETARAARAALTFRFAARQGWVTHDPELLTVGVRDAYASGLLLAIPTGPNELGYAVQEGDRG